MDKLQVENRLHNLSEKRKNAKSKQNKETSFRSGAHKLAYTILHDQTFELVFGAVIVFNLIAVIVETDSVAKEDAAPTWLYAASLVVLILFIFELALRLFVLQMDFFFDESNVFDFVLVLTDAVFNVIGPFLLGEAVLDVSLLRVARLCKLARVSKAFNVFPELRLMMAGLLGSLKVILWGTVLLTFAVLVFAILAVQFIQVYNTEVATNGGYADCERCPRAYASVWDATVTLVQQVITGDDWSSVTVPIIDHAPSTAIYFALVYLMIGMALINLILGVVVSIASQARERLSTEMDEEVLMERLEENCGLRLVCEQLDKDQDGLISRDEMMEGFAENEQFRDALEFIDISKDDLEVLWTILDTDKAGAVGYSEFVAMCYKLKTSNTHFILAHVKYYMTVIKNILSEQIDGVLRAETKLGEEIKEEERRLAGEVHHFEKEAAGEMQHLAEEIHDVHLEMYKELDNLPIGCAHMAKSPGNLCVESPKSVEAYHDHAAHGAAEAETRQLLELGTCLTGELKSLIDGMKKPSVVAPAAKADKDLVTCLLDELKTLIDGVKKSSVPEIGDVDDMVEKELVTCLFGELKMLVDDMKNTNMFANEKVEKLIEYKAASLTPVKDHENAPFQCTAKEWQIYSDVMQKVDQQQKHLVEVVQGMTYKLDLAISTPRSTPALTKSRLDNLEKSMRRNPLDPEMSSFAIPTGLVSPKFANVSPRQLNVGVW